MGEARGSTAQIPQEEVPECAGVQMVMRSVGRQKGDKMKSLSSSFTRDVTGEVSQAPSFIMKTFEVTSGLRMALPALSQVDQEAKQLYTNARNELSFFENSMVSFVRKLQSCSTGCERLELALEKAVFKIMSMYRNTDTTAICKYNSQFFQKEIELVRDAASYLKKAHMELEKDDRGLTFSWLQKVQDDIVGGYSQDAESDIADALKKFDKSENDLREMICTEKQQKGTGELARAHEKDAQRDLEAIEARLQILEGAKRDFEDSISALRASDFSTFEKLQEGVRQDMDRLEQLRKELDARRTHELQTAGARDEERVKYIDSKQREFEELMMQTKKTCAGNHIIFILDRSGSMRGPRWASLMSAFEAFRLVRKEHGNADKMSVILFNSKAQTTALAVPIGTGNPGVLGQDPGGGTNYTPAWEEAKYAAEATPEGYRTVLVFMTDGISHDGTRGAESLAAGLHKTMSSRGGLLTFAVAFENDFDRSSLESIVLAGNGGVQFHTMGGEKIPLLMHAKMEDLTTNFQRIATTLSTRESEFKERIIFWEFKREEQAKALEQSIAKEQKIQRDMEEEGMRALSHFREGRQRGAEDSRALTDTQVEYCKKRVSELAEQIEEVKKQRTVIQEDLEKSKVVAVSVEEFFAKTGDNRSSLKDTFIDIQKTQLEQLEKIRKDQQALLDSLGTTNEGHKGRLLRDSRAYIELRRREHIVVGHQSEAVATLCWLATDVADTLDKPLTTDELPIVSHADFIFEHYKGCGLDIKERCHQLQNFRAIIEHTASQMRYPPPADQIDFILQEFTVTQLCDVKRSEQDLAEKKKACEEKLKEQIAKFAKKMHTLQLRVTRLDTARKISSQKFTEATEKWESALVGEDEQLIDKLDSLKETAEDQWKLKKEQLEDAKSLLDEAFQEYQPLMLLLRTLIDDFYRSFAYVVAEIEMDILKNDMVSIFKQLHVPLRHFRANVVACLQACNPILNSTSSEQATRASTGGALMVE